MPRFPRARVDAPAAAGPQAGGACAPRPSANLPTAWAGRLGRGLCALAACCCAMASLAEPVPDTCGIHYPSDAGIAWTCHRVVRGDTPIGLFGPDWQDGLRFNRIDRRHL